MKKQKLTNEEFNKFKLWLEENKRGIAKQNIEIMLSSLNPNIDNLTCKKTGEIYLVSTGRVSGLRRKAVLLYEWFKRGK